MNNLKFKIIHKRENWEHIQLITDFQLIISRLSENIKKQMIEFSTQYHTVLADNRLDEMQFDRLSDKSKKIAQQIREEIPELFQIQKKKSGSGLLAVFGGLALIAGAALGIKHLNNS